MMNKYNLRILKRLYKIVGLHLMIITSEVLRFVNWLKEICIGLTKYFTLSLIQRINMLDIGFLLRNRISTLHNI